MKVSVIVPTYNHEKYIKKCLDSIINQKTNFKFEVLIGEDNSTDKTREIVREYERRYPNLIKVYYRDGKDKIVIDGITSGVKNFVELLKDCKGEYVGICEGDDFWNTEKKLQTQVDFLDNHKDYSMCFSNAYIVNENDEIMSDYNRWDDYDKDTYKIEDLLRKNIIPTASVLFRNLLDFRNLPEWFYTIITSDWLLHILNCQFGNAMFFRERLSSYRIHDQGIWTSRDNHYKKMNAIKLRHIINKYFNYKYDDVINDATIDVYEEIIDINNRLRKYYDLTSKMLKMIDFDVRLAKYFSSYEREIYIFGSGEIGQLLYLHMNHAGIKVSGFIESKLETYNGHVKTLFGLPFYNYDNVRKIKNVIIVVTPFYDFDEIKTKLFLMNPTLTIISVKELVDMLQNLNIEEHF